MFLKIAGYGMAALGAYGGVKNYAKLQSDVSQSSAARALLKLDPSGMIAQQPSVVALAKQLDDDVSTDKHALLIDAGLVGIGLFIATRG